MQCVCVVCESHWKERRKTKPNIRHLILLRLTTTTIYCNYINASFTHTHIRIHTLGVLGNKQTNKPKKIHNEKERKKKTTTTTATTIYWNWNDRKRTVHILTVCMLLLIYTQNQQQHTLTQYLNEKKAAAAATATNSNRQQ